MAAPFATARKHAGRITTGFTLLVRRPRELPRNLGLAAQWLWNVKVRRKRLVLLVREGGLGDLACLLACVPGLRERHPNSWLVVISPPGCWKLVRSSQLADATADQGGFFHRFIEGLCARSSFYRPLLPDEYDPPRPQVLHLADEFARALGVTYELSRVRFKAPPRVRRRLARRLREANPRQRPVVVLHPGPTWPVREWPPHRWSELAELISAHTSALMVKIGTDFDSTHRLRPFPAIRDAVDWTNQLDVIETAALLEQASALVGIDSGPLHIAGVLRVPAVGLFGPIFGHLRIHPHARTIAVSGGVDCLGCHHAPTGHLHWRTGCPNDIACMQEITAKDVFAAVAYCLETDA